MSNVKKWDEFINESVSLSQKEKDFLWAKMEVKKKAKAKESDSDIYQQLQGSKSISSDEEFISVLNSLEYSMKKRVKSGEAPKGKYEEAFNSLKKKLPSDWAGVKFSSLKAKANKDERKPKETSTKKEITTWLDKKGIKYDDSDTKAELIKKVK